MERGTPSKLSRAAAGSASVAGLYKRSEETFSLCEEPFPCARSKPTGEHELSAEIARFGCMLDAGRVADERTALAKDGASLDVGVADTAEHSYK